MLKTLDLYRRLISVQIRSQMQYPGPFVLDTVATAFSLALYFVSLALIFERFGTMGGWRLAEIAFLYGMVEASFGWMDMIFSGFDPQMFGQHIRRGTFDQLLLRPVGITLQVFGSKFVIRRIGKITQGMLFFGGAILLLDIHWTWLKVAYLPVVFISMICFFGGLFIIGSTFTFWTIQSVEAMNIFTYGGSEMMAYPMHIYQDWLRRFFTFVLPAIFLNYYPALFFLDKPDPFDLPPFAPFLSPVAGLSVLSAALLFWRFGLKRYQSTGS